MRSAHRPAASRRRARAGLRLARRTLGVRADWHPPGRHRARGAALAQGQRRYADTVRHPVSGRLWAAATVSAIGDYVGLGALLILAFERSGGRMLGPAALFAAQAIPGLLSGAIAGSWLDRLPRRPVMVALQIAGAGALVLPLLLSGLTVVLVAAGILGAIRAAFASVRSAAIAEGVPGHLRGSLLALFGVSDQTSQVIGYLTGAGMAVTFGAVPALLTDALTFLAAAVVLTTLPLPRPSIREARPPITAGLRIIWSNPVLRLLAPLVWITAAVAAIPEALAAGIAGADSPMTPLVMAAGPAGQAATLAWLGRRREVERPSFQLIHLAFLSLAFALAALGTGAVWFIAGNLAIGAGVAWILGPQTLFVRIAPPERMAQITGTMIAVLIAAEGAGTVALAGLADARGIGAAYWVAGMTVLVAAIVGWVIKERTPEVADIDKELAAIEHGLKGADGDLGEAGPGPGVVDQERDDVDQGSAGVP
ncbi:MAG: MFS transporter [Nitriliruptorales bacterium]